METLFLIPTLISPDCPTKIVPALCKLIERNILLSYSSVFRKAALLKYLGPKKGLSDSSEVLDRMYSLVELLEADDEDSRPRPRRPDSIGGRTTEGDKWSGKPEAAKPDAREVPRGLSFFTTISLEPTYLEIPLEGRSSAYSDETETRVIRIGMKAIPFKLDGVDDLMTAMSEARNRSYTINYLKKIAGRLKKELIGGVFNGDIDAMKAEFFSIMPTYRELENPNYVARRLGDGNQAYWSILTIFVSDDFKNQNLKELLWRYRELVNGGWGDMIIIDDARDIINFCTQKMLACFQLHMDYLKELLSLDNVLDADLFKKSGSNPLFPGHKVPISKVFESTCIPCSERVISEVVKGIRK